MFCKSSRVKSRRFTSRVLRRLQVFEDDAGRTRTSVYTTSLTLIQEGNSTSLPPPRNSFSRRCCCDSDTGQSPHVLKPAITLEGLSMMALLHAVLTKRMAVLRLMELSPPFRLYSRITASMLALKGLNTAASSGCRRLVAFAGRSTRMILSRIASRTISPL